MDGPSAPNRDADGPVQPVGAFNDLEQRLEACRRVTLEAISLQAETRLLIQQLTAAATASAAVGGHLPASPILRVPRLRSGAID